MAPGSENSKVPPEAPSMLAPEESTFDEVAREALKAAEKIFHEGDTLATPIPPAAWIEDPLLRIKDILA